MATYSNNTTIKFLQGVTLVNSGSYTVPAGCYAILSVAQVSGSPGSGGEIPFPGSSGYVYVDGRAVSANNNGTVSGVNGLTEMYIPEGKVVSVSVNNKGTAYALLSVFKNSP